MHTSVRRRVFLAWKQAVGVCFWGRSVWLSVAAATQWARASAVLPPAALASLQHAASVQPRSDGNLGLRDLKQERSLRQVCRKKAELRWLLHPVSVSVIVILADIILILWKTKLEPVRSCVFLKLRPAGAFLLTIYKVSLESQAFTTKQIQHNQDLSH